MVDAGRHEGDGPVDGGEHIDQPELDESPWQAPRDAGDVQDKSDDGKRARKHRRVRTEPVAGSDPNPQPEPPRHTGHENDDRLKADKPPHWG